MKKPYILFLLCVSGLSGYTQPNNYRINSASFSNNSLNYITGVINIPLTYTTQLKENDSITIAIPIPDAVINGPAFSYYPNPVANKLFIRYNKELELRFEIEIYNDSGQLVIQRFIYKETVVDLSQLIKGTYTVIPKIEGTESFKIIKN
ncbi:T9SS type A sorting domain-containing protein [Flavobacterium inviolabile]|uniref:T9SS type A sorting domain-containing protein n=1 Tax=Flavobacterium inviolabile TaxID=2748320 RepID=UPI0015AB4196|nr:T9SS type A sorting domain-containing protein [Flavobacterium inviolabile]